LKLVAGLDRSQSLLRKAGLNLRKEICAGKVVLIRSDASDRLPFRSNTFDALLASELLECLPPRRHPLFLRDAARVLKPGGRLLLAHTDWDTQVWNGTDKPLTRKMVHAFCDAKQPWMDHADGWMGRKLAGLLMKCPRFKNTRLGVQVQMETTYKPSCYGYQLSRDLLRLARERGSGISTREVSSFLSGLMKQSRRGDYFYSVNRYWALAERR
jgi:hypothetical protein